MVLRAPPLELSSFHKINTLTFGDYFPGIVNPLDRESSGVKTHPHLLLPINISSRLYTYIIRHTIQSNQLRNRSAAIQSMRILLRSLSNEGYATAIAEDEVEGLQGELCGE
ncbi:hypothetical protein Bca4012_054914 [Brassica carinata]